MDLFTQLAEITRPVSVSELTPTSIGKIPIPITRENLYSLIYGNGGNQPATIQFHADGGHGWLQVPHKLLRDMGISKKVTRYSFMDTNYAYLEEDCDLSTFVQALHIPQNGLMKTFWEICPQNDTEDSPVRRKNHYC